MYVIKLSISSNKAARQLIDTGVQYPKSFMVLWEYSLQSFYFQLQSVQARHYSKHDETHGAHFPITIHFYVFEWNSESKYKIQQR